MVGAGLLPPGNQSSRADGAQRGDEGQVDDDGDEDDRDARRPDRAHDLGVEQHQTAEGDGHGQTREQHGPAGGGDGPCGGLDDVIAGEGVPSSLGVGRGDPPQLLAVAAHREQSVVDRESEPEQGDDVDDAGVEVDEVGEREQRGEAAGDGGDGTGDRHPGGHEPTEDEHHDDERQGQGDPLPGLQVRLDLVGDGVDQRPHPTDRAGRTGERGDDGVELLLRRRVGGSPLRRGEVLRERRHRDEAAAGGAPAAEERRRLRVLETAGQQERRRDRADARDRGQVLGRGRRRRDGGRVGQVRAGDLQGEAVGAGLVLLDEVLAGLRLARCRRRPRVQALEQRLAGDPADRDGEGRNGDDDPDEHEPPRVPGGDAAQPRQPGRRVCRGRGLAVAG